MKALILDNKVVDISEEKFPVAPAMSWIDDVPEEVQAGWTVENGELIAPPPPYEKTYAEKRRKEYNAILGEYLDGIVKDDQAQIDKYIADCKAIKTKYPKP